MWHQFSGAYLCHRAPLDILQFYARSTQDLWRMMGLNLFQGLMKPKVILNILRFKAGHAWWVATVVFLGGLLPFLKLTFVAAVCKMGWCVFVLLNVFLSKVFQDNHIYHKLHLGHESGLRTSVPVVEDTPFNSDILPFHSWLFHLQASWNSDGRWWRCLRVRGDFIKKKEHVKFLKHRFSWLEICQNVQTMLEC